MFKPVRTINFVFSLSLVFAFFQNGFTQSGHVESRNPSPRVSKDRNFLTAENFPGYSKKKNAILLAHTDNSCCSYSGTFLWEIDVDGMRIVKKIMLDAPDDSVSLIKIDQFETLRLVENLVRDRSYESMEQLGSDFFTVKHLLNTEQYNIDFWFGAGGDEKHVSFELDDFTLPVECCTGGLKTTERCLDSPNSYNLWIDREHKVVLLQYGIISQANGCDAGPLYVTKRL